MTDFTPWPWTESLGVAGADPRQTLRVKRIGMGPVQDWCRKMGLREGAELRCRERSSQGLVLELPGGGMHPLELPYAWFIQVEAVPD